MESKSKGSGVEVRMAYQETNRTLGCLGHNEGGRECYAGRSPVGHSKDFDFKCDGESLEVLMQGSDMI